MTLFKATQRTVRIEERYIEANSKEDVLELINWEDAGCDNAHFVDTEIEDWEIEESEE
ncbi:hypothetical protein STP1_1963 [Staphylococcus pasteuri SP1]|nr:hypothetical protein STP1_1963 [Staphylococcus pasteuri SP1]